MDAEGTAMPPLDSEYPLSPEQIAAYRRDGFVVLRNVLSPEEIHAFRPRITQFVQKVMPELKPLPERSTYGKAFIQVTHLWNQDATLAGLSLSRRFGKIVADLMGVDAVRIYHDQALYKEPGGGRTPWHQDLYYIPLDGPHVLTLWIPLVDVCAEMGAMHFAAGSHRDGCLYDGPKSDAVDAYLQDVIRQRGWPIRDTADLAAGDAVLHAGWTLHSAPGNATERTREVFNVVYFAEGSRIVERLFWQNAVRDYLPGQQLGERAGTPINPIVFQR
jgi:ectoine hydroxylase-related dioxygenase (phytanoyl-CoA dioxygenase family)